MTEESALVSIVVPVYGTEAYLPVCVESLLRQTYTNLEIILVDDESPDNCPMICDKYAQSDPRVSVIHQKNKGVSGARNAGLLQASGEYIMFVDSDDTLYSEAVELLLNDAYRYNADIVTALQNVADLNGQITWKPENGQIEIYEGDETVRLSLQGADNTNSACAKLFKASFIRGLCFETGKNINEDGFYIFLCYLRQPVLVQHNVTVYQCNTRPGSGSRQFFSEEYLSMLYFCDKKKALIAEQYPELIEQAYSMEVRTNLFLLDKLCSTTEKKYRPLQKQCANTVRSLYRYHVPLNDHHKLLAWIAAHGLYPLYKQAVRLKYYR